MTIPSSGNDFIDALIGGYSWTGGTGSSALDLRYSTIANPTFSNSVVSGSSDTTGIGLGSAFNNLVASALQSWANVANLSFDYLPYTGSGSNLLTRNSSGILTNLELAFTYDTKPFNIISGLDNAYGATVNLPVSGSGTQEADVYINRTLLPSIAYGDEGYVTLIHEIGHALGLSHPDDGTPGFGSSPEGAGDSFFGVNFPDANENMDSSVMISLVPTGGTYTSDFILPVGPQIYDIAAIQYLYSANTSYNSGNTSYNFDGSAYAYTIWDGGGTDTLNQSTNSNNVVLNLNESVDAVTQVGLTRVWNAFGANIENAISGSGNDIIYGNILSNTLTAGSGNDLISGGIGNDVIYGGRDNDIIRGGKGYDTIYGGQGPDVIYGERGNDVIYGDIGRDTLYGGDANDIFVFAAGNGHDTIMDFEQGQDKLQFSSSLFSNASAVLSATTSNVISMADGGDITVIFLTGTTLTASDITIV